MLRLEEETELTAEEEKQEVEQEEVSTSAGEKFTLRMRFGAFFSRLWATETAVQSGEPDSARLAEERTDLARHRTLMAADRTLMAWVRTALSMISFGFTIYKILQGFQHSGEGFIEPKYDPQTVGLFLVGLGTFSMLMGTIEYWQTIKELHLINRRPIRRPSFVISLIMAVLGVSMFVSIVAEVI